MTPPPLNRVLHHARAAATMARSRPAYAAGVRAAIATVVPLLADHLLGLGGGPGTWMSLAGLNGGIADRGGPYRTRATTLGMLAAASASAVALGSIVGGHLLVAVPVTLLLATACTLARVWGDAGATIGVTSLLTFVIALALPPVHPAAALVRAGWILAGGLWSMLVSLVLWPLRPYRPVRLAVAACWRALAAYTADAADRVREGVAPDAWELRTHIADTRRAIEAARGVLALSRRGRPGESARGESLLVLHELADQLFVHLVALIDAVASVRRGERDPDGDAAVVRGLDAAAATARAIAEGIERERGIPSVAVRWNGEPVRSSAVEYVQAAALLDRMAEYAGVAAATLRALATGHPVPMPEDMLIAEEPPPVQPLFAARAILGADSVVLRHALRVGLVTAVAVWLGGAFRLNHGYWVTITAVVILQPYAGATTQKALQRVVGTVLGGVIAAGLSAALHDPRAVMVLVALFTAACVALLPINYGAYTIFGTPAFVLLAEVGSADWHLSGLRVVNTLLGGALALAGSRLFRPAPETTRFADFAAAAVRATRDYIGEAVALAASAGARPVATLRDARRALALAAANAEDSFQRLLGEHDEPADTLEPRMALLTYVRRISASTSALALAPHGPVEADARRALERFARTATHVLDDLADAVAAGRAPAPLPALDAVAMAGDAGAPLLRARMSRLSRQLKSLHDAAEHWLAPGSAADAVDRPRGSDSSRPAA